MPTYYKILVFLISVVVTNPVSFASEVNDKQNEKLLAQINQLVDKRKLRLEIFRKGLAHNNQKIVVSTIMGLGRIGGESIIPLLEPYLNSKMASVRKAVAFSLGISATPRANRYLWQQLAIETNHSVKQEIYLALGNLGQDQLVNKILARLAIEKSSNIQATMFQALAMTLTFHSAIKNDFTKIDYENLLLLVEKDNPLSGRVLYFLARIKNIDKHIQIAQLSRLTSKIVSIPNKRILAKLVGRVVTQPHYANRKILSWLIEQSEQPDIALVTESIRSMSNFVNIPQARIQLGKLHASSHSLVAQTALLSLANSALEGKKIIKLLKEQLKSENSGMVVVAMKGLIERQKREDMTWALKILAHKNAYVKNNFANLIYIKDKDGFKNVLKMLSKDPNKLVSKHALELINKKTQTDSFNSKKTKTTSYSTAIESTTKQVIIQTSKGNITLQLLSEAPYTSLNFITLVENGFYNGSYFNRVIGNFVTQGGDPIGDGEGSSQNTIREEISYLAHVPRTVGMATSGKDTGDSQFFFNTAENIHLDRNYTIFAQVVAGWENVLSLSNGDQILRAYVVK